MNDFILFMHDDTSVEPKPEQWEAYFTRLRESRRFAGGSAVGPGQSFKKGGTPGAVHELISGYIKVTAADVEEAKSFLEGNPVFECGGTVEIRELPRD